MEEIPASLGQLLFGYGVERKVRGSPGRYSTDGYWRRGARSIFDLLWMGARG